MTEHPDIVVLMAGRTPFEAQVIAGVLAGAGIPVYVDGALLTDPVAVSATVTNTEQIDIHVPADRLEAAREALRASSEAAHLLDDPEFDPGDRTDDV
ncbi:MAG: DUF2007 domain-containing protein [Planctomycetes bacterium]|nr:DUF2007 domain-containing protein [Planctomycetota bacterium]